MKFPCISEQEECIIISVLVFGISYANEHQQYYSVLCNSKVCLAYGDNHFTHANSEASIFATDKHKKLTPSSSP